MSELLLKQDEVPMGARVHVYLPGEGKPHGDPDVFQVLSGGVPQRRKFYPFPEGVQVSENYVLSMGIEGWIDTVRFSPTQVYTPEIAPVGGKYAVFENGQRMRRELRSGDYLLLQVAKGYQGEFILSNVFPFEELQMVPADDGLRRLDRLPNQRLIDLLRGLNARRDMYCGVKIDSSLKDLFAQDDWQSELIVETLVRKHRDSPADLIRFMKDIGPAGNRYLQEQQLSSNAQLVRVDERMFARI